MTLVGDAARADGYDIIATVQSGLMQLHSAIVCRSSCRGNIALLLHVSKHRLYVSFEDKIQAYSVAFLDYFVLDEYDDVVAGAKYTVYGDEKER